MYGCWKTTVGRYPLQHYLSVLRDLIKTFCETREFQCLLLWFPGLRARRTGRQPFDIRLQAVRPALQGKTTKQLRPIRDDDDDDVGLHVLGWRVDILADQRRERHFKKRWIQAAFGAQWSMNRRENLHYYILFIVQKILFVFCRRESSLTFRIYKTIVYGPRKHSGVSLIS